MYEVYYTFKCGKKVCSRSMRVKTFEMACRYADMVCNNDNIVHCAIYKRDLLVFDVL